MDLGRGALLLLMHFIQRSALVCTPCVQTHGILCHILFSALPIMGGIGYSSQPYSMGALPRLPTMAVYSIWSGPRVAAEMGVAYDGPLYLTAGTPRKRDRLIPPRRWNGPLPITHLCARS
jgi:hypothetical protein